MTSGPSSGEAARASSYRRPRCWPCAFDPNFEDATGGAGASSLMQVSSCGRKGLPTTHSGSPSCVHLPADRASASQESSAPPAMPRGGSKCAATVWRRQTARTPSAPLPAACSDRLACACGAGWAGTKPGGATTTEAQHPPHADPYATRTRDTFSIQLGPTLPERPTAALGPFAGRAREKHPPKG